MDTETIVAVGCDGTNVNTGSLVEQAASSHIHQTLGVGIRKAFAVVCLPVAFEWIAIATSA